MIDAGTSRHRQDGVILDGESEHQLRNYIAVVITLCDLLRSEALADTTRQDIGEIDVAAKAALAILSDAPKIAGRADPPLSIRPEHAGQ